MFAIGGTVCTAAQPDKADPAKQNSAASDWPELDPKLPRLSFNEAAFRDADGDPKSLSQSQLMRWLSPVPGQNHRFFETNRGRGIVAGYEGLVRLRAPWPSDAVLALTPFDHHGMAVYFWNGRTGVSLHYFQHPRPNWAAYRITRKDTELQPATYALAATDNDVYFRSLAGAIEIRHQDGALVVNRGDLHLLTVPLDAPPTEVYFDKRAWLRTLTMYRAEPFPYPDPASGRGAPIRGELVPAGAALTKDSAPASPASLDWPLQPAAGTTFKRLKDGSVELASEKTAATAWSAVKIPHLGLYEVVFRLGEATPGTGIYFGDDTGKPLYVLSVMRDQRTRQPAIQFQQPNANWFEMGADLNQLQAPFIGPGQWLRLIVGSGTIKCWTSGDGVHWSRVLDPLRGIRGGWSHVGLLSSKWNDPRRIVLEHLRISELTAFSNFADPQLCARVPATVINGDPNPPAWQARVVESLPSGVDMTAWRAACAMRTLASVPPSNLGNLLLTGLIEENAARQVPAAERLATLNQLAEVYDAWDHQDSYRLSQNYEQLARRLMREGDREPWTKAASLLLSAPICTNAQFQTVPDSPATAELLFRIVAEEWSEVRQLCRRLTLYSRPAYPEQGWPDNRQRTRLLVEWSRVNAERALADKLHEGQADVTVPFHWQHPLIANSSKEGFNTLAELDAALAEQSYRDACQIISSARPDLALGLFPDGGDPRLLLSLTQAVDLAMRDNPQLQQTMVSQFSAIGRLRLQQAAADANPRVMQALAVQFFGTSAAATAHQWLGDRALVIGDFAWAASEYEQALRSAEPDQRPSISARLRLAAAMLGRDAGEPVKETVSLETVKVAPDAFERLVAEMKQQAVAKGIAPPAVVESSPRLGVKPVRYEVQHRAALRGDVGENPGNPNSGEIDWVARQTGWSLVKDVLYLSNRFQVTAYNVKSRQQVWTQPVGKEQAPANGWPLTPARPVVAGERLYVRRLAKANPELVCLNSANGQVRWTTKNAVNVASDPLLLQDRVYALTFATPHENGLSAIDFSQIDATSGDVVSQQPVIQLRNLWDRQLSCQAVIAGTRIVGVAGGTVFCCDFTGRPVWVRRQQWIPPSQALAANEQSPSVPLVIGNRLFVSQPGVFAMECLDLETGRRVWQEPIPDLRRMIGLTGERLIVETARGWQALGITDGNLLWQHDADQVLDAQVCPASGDLLVARREIQQNDVWRAVLLWLNAETGRELARLPLDQLNDKQPFLGPVVVDQDHLWALFGRTLRDPHRDLFELLPTADPAQAPRATARLSSP
jgi:outer membrane protein assembly factor BamB